MKRQRLSPELIVSPFDELDKRYIHGRVINVTYHLTDWWKCFHTNISEGTFNDAIQGFCLTHPQHTVAEAIYNLQRMSDKHIREYAKTYNDCIDSNVARFHAGLYCLSPLDYMG